MKPLRLGNIELGIQLGEGGFGNVYAAESPHFPFRIAVKVLDVGRQREASKARERFEREVKVLFRLRHPHIIQVLMRGETDDGRPYFVMERFPGQDLRTAREVFLAATPNRPPDATRVLQVFKKLAAGLAFAHQKDVVHRDIKPRNLMANATDARILDFGIAAALDPDSERYTKTGGTMVGNDSFTPQELIDNPRLVDPRCDIYSLGSCWFWTLTGKVPRGNNVEHELRKLGSISVGYERIVRRCVMDISKRYQSGNELLEDIAILEGGGTPKPPGMEDDDLARVLGAIFEGSRNTDEAATRFELEQRLGRSMSQLRIGVAIHKLVRMNLIAQSQGEDSNGLFYPGFTATAEGEDWVADHVDRIETLLRPPPPAPSAQVDLDDDVPF